MKTAIEWLMDEIKAIDKETYATLINEGKFDKAKSINKKQHDDTWIDSSTHHKGDDYIGEEKSFEQYYNETYNK